MTLPPKSHRSHPVRLSPGEINARLASLYGPCVLCELRCGAMRDHGERGACGLDHRTHVYNRLLHMGEEAPLVPSYTLFLSACNLMCSFCSEWKHLTPPFTRSAIEPEQLATKAAADLERYQARVRTIRNINFVGGEPSIALPFIARFAEALTAQIGQHPPLLLNTNGYMTPEALALATHLCPIMVVDLKFGPGDCAESIAGIPNYWEFLTRNLTLLHQAIVQPHDPPQVDGVPVLPVQLWVRHLLMPNHLACCTAPCLEWLARNAPQAHVNVMPAFFPFKGQGNDAWPHLKSSERDEGLALLHRSGLARAYFDGRRVVS
ncbi:MAG: radical SAM protein [Myxococcota bacterium]